MKPLKKAIAHVVMFTVVASVMTILAPVLLVFAVCGMIDWAYREVRNG